MAKIFQCPPELVGDLTSLSELKLRANGLERLTELLGRCFRYGGPYEHPKGRACDFSLQKSGFSVAHNMDMKTL